MSRKTFVVAWTEYLRAVRTRAFIIGVLLTPVLFGGGIIAVAISKKARDVSERRFAVVDRGDGTLWRALDEAAKRRDREELHAKDGAGRQIAPRFVPERVEPGADANAQGLELSRRVERGELFGFVVLGRDLAELPGSDEARDVTFDWQTATPTYSELPQWISTVVNEAVREERFRRAGLDRALVERVSRRLSPRDLGLTRVGSGGEVVQARQSNKAVTVGVPLILAGLMFMLVMSTAPALLNTVLEEKMQKIAEVLVGSVDPFDLLLGKLLGALLTALTLATIYVGAGLVFLNVAPDVPPELTGAVGTVQLLWFAFFLVMALLIYGSIFAALGAACTEMQDAQSLMGPVMTAVILPVFFIGPILDSPDGPLSRALSFFPPATPTLMLLRANIPPGPAVWELAVAVAITVVFTLLCVLAGSRIFRIGILSQGQAPTWRRLLRWMVTK